MNGKIDIVSYLAAFCIALAFLTGCNKGLDTRVEDPASSGTPISFTSEDSWTRAETSNLAAIQSGGFQVWGKLTTDTYPNGTQQFGESGTLVTYAAAKSEWTYSPVRYWMKGTYDFFAVYPPSLAESATVDSRGVKFDYDVTTQKDILAAHPEPIKGEERPSAVRLDFSHLLSKLEFAAKSSSSFKAELNGIDIKIVAKSASYSSATSQWSNHQVSRDIIYTVRGNENLGSAYVTLESDILMIPQDYKDVILVVRYMVNGTQKSVNLSIPSYTDKNGNTVTTWQPGFKYTYNLSVEGSGPDTPIIFDVPTVTPWVEAYGGGFLIN